MNLYRLFLKVIIIALITSCASNKYKIKQQPCDCQDIPQQPKRMKHSQILPQTQSPVNKIIFTV